MNAQCKQVAIILDENRQLHAPAQNCGEGKIFATDIVSLKYPTTFDKPWNTHAHGFYSRKICNDFTNYFGNQFYQIQWFPGVGSFLSFPNQHLMPTVGDTG